MVFDHVKFFKKLKLFLPNFFFTLIVLARTEIFILSGLEEFPKIKFLFLIQKFTKFFFPFKRTCTWPRVVSLLKMHQNIKTAQAPKVSKEESERSTSGRLKIEQYSF